MDKTAQQIKDNIQHFDLLALLRLLRHLGYSNIWFASHDSLISEQRIVETIEFTSDAVVISLNLGLLSPQSPLPGYILQLRDTLMDRAEEFRHFIGYFDHIILQQLVHSLFPEFDHSAFGHWHNYQSQALAMTNLKSVRTIQSVFDYVYPEYHIHTQPNQKIKVQQLTRTPLGQVVTGNHYLLGDTDFVKEEGVVVTLFEQDKHFDIAQLQRRLRLHILPLLAPLSLHLEVRIQGRLRPLKTGNAGFTTPLGFHALGSAQQAGKVTLFYGQTHGYGRSSEQS